MKRTDSGSRLGVALLAPLLLLVSFQVSFLNGCVSTAPPERTAVMEDVGVNVTARRARMAAQNAASWYMSTIEVTANAIADSTSDPQVRLNAVAWKANAIPAFQRAMYQSDPLVSFVDGWTLVVQMRQYLEAGIGKDLFGTHQHLAVDAMRDLESGIGERVNAVVDPEPREQLTSFVYRWADEHPLERDLVRRRSVSEQVIDLLSQQTGGGLSQIGSLAQMAEEAQQMALVLASYVPKEIRWQSELMLAELADTARVAPMLDTIQRMELVQATTRFMDETPELIAKERAAVFRDIAAERMEVLSDLERQRLETMAQAIELIQNERTIMLREVRELIAEERAAVLASVEDLTAQAFIETRGVIDHLMIWIVFLGLGGAVLGAVAFTIYRRRTSRSVS